MEGGIRTFESGLTVKVFIGALFVGLLMMPGSIYLSYVSGESGAGAAPWVAVILFTELARRSFTTARRQELYMLPRVNRRGGRKWTAVPELHLVRLLHQYPAGGFLRNCRQNSKLDCASR